MPEPSPSDMNTILSTVKVFAPGAPRRQFSELGRVFPQRHFERLFKDDFHFYRSTFWYPLERQPENAFESVVSSLRPLADPSSNVVGVEWWFSVLLTNATPQWLLPCHFDRNDLVETDLAKLRYPREGQRPLPECRAIR